MYQDEQKEHLESFREGVLNIMGVSLLKEASKDAIQICNLASNPVRFIPTRNSSPDLPAPGPVSEGATLPKACILEPPQRNTQLVSDTSSVQPELPSAAPLDFDDVESHLGNSVSSLPTGIKSNLKKYLSNRISGRHQIRHPYNPSQSAYERRPPTPLKTDRPSPIGNQRKVRRTEAAPQHVKVIPQT
jgi:hypothetical protein